MVQIEHRQRHAMELFSSALAVSALVADGSVALNRRWLGPVAEGVTQG
jgi:hypothetical protein